MFPCMEKQRLKVFMLTERFARPHRATSRGSARSEALENLIEQKGSVVSICSSNKTGLEGLES
jgi:hypothetical protein